MLRFSDAQQKFNTDLGLDNFDAAKNDILDMQRARDADPGILKADDLARLDSDLAQARKQWDLKQADFQSAQHLKDQERARQDEIERLHKIQVERDNEIAALVAQCKTQINEQNYAAALGILEQILALDPHNDFATTVRMLVEDKAILQDQRAIREKFDRNFAKQLNIAEEETVPYSDLYRFPDDWPAISDLRDREVQTTGQSGRCRRLRLTRKAVALGAVQRHPAFRCHRLPARCHQHQHFGALADSSGGRR